MSLTGWSTFWLNDRKVPRRPWLHCPQWKVIDSMLEELVPQFQHRALPTAFASHFMQTRDSKGQGHKAVLARPYTPHVCHGPLAVTPTEFVFGFGSLISTASRIRSSPLSKDAIPVMVSADFGYRREWNFQPSGSAKFTALGLCSTTSGIGDEINGVLYPVGDDLEALDEREHGYIRVQIPLRFLTPLSWQKLPYYEEHHHSLRVWTYVPVQVDHLPGCMSSGPCLEYPILQTCK